MPHRWRCQLPRRGLSQAAELVPPSSGDGIAVPAPDRLRADTDVRGLGGGAGEDARLAGLGCPGSWSPSAAA